MKMQNNNIAHCETGCQATANSEALYLGVNKEHTEFDGAQYIWDLMQW